MDFDHHCGSDRDDRLFDSPADAHARRTQEQASRLAADLAIARWSGAAAVAAPARAVWLVNAQQGLQQWFDAGGFAQDDGAAQVPRVAPSLTGSRPRLYTDFRNAGSKAV